MALTTQPAVIGGASKSLIVAADANGNIAAAHVLITSAGVETGTVANSLIVSDPAAETSLAAIATNTSAGTDATGITAPAGATGLRGWASASYGKLASIASALTGTLTVTVANFPSPSGAASTVAVSNFPSSQAVTATSLPLPSGASQDGADATGVTAPTGGTGIRGWLSGIYSRLGSPLAVTGTFYQATQPVSGTVTANAGTGTMTVAVQGTVPVSGTFYPASQAVTIAALPALAAGSATIGAVTQSGGPWTVSWTGQTVASTQSGTWTVGLAAGSSVTLGAGSAAIGTVGVTALPSLPAGSATIGNVGQANGPWSVSWSGQSVAITGNVAVTGTFWQTTQPVSMTVLPALVAGEAHVGEVGGNVGKFAGTFGPASSTTYSTGQIMSAAIEITSMGRIAGGTGLITSPTLVLKTANVQQVDLVFFTQQPTATYTAGLTFTIDPADIAKVSKTIKLTDWTSLGAAVSMGEASPAPKFYRCEDGTKTTSLWVVPVARGSITLAAATDATLTVRAARN